MQVTTTHIWEEFSQHIFNFIQAKIPVKEDAEDLLLEVFTKIHNGINKLREEEKVQAWVFTIARNAVNTYWTKKKAEKNFVFEEDTEEAFHEQFKHMEHCLRNMINELPEKYAQPLLLSEMEEMKQQDVADKLSLSLSATKSRIQRGRKMLKQAIIDCCNFQLNEKGQIVSGFSPEECKHCA